eukprot:7462134-Pyramimonas_sp.AAC.1
MGTRLLNTAAIRGTLAVIPVHFCKTYFIYDYGGGAGERGRGEGAGGSERQQPRALPGAGAAAEQKVPHPCGGELHGERIFGHLGLLPGGAPGGGDGGGARPRHVQAAAEVESGKSGAAGSEARYQRHQGGGADREPQSNSTAAGAGANNVCHAFAVHQ